MIVSSAAFKVGGQTYLAAYDPNHYAEDETPASAELVEHTIRVSWVTSSSVPLGLSLFIGTATKARGWEGKLMRDGEHDTVKHDIAKLKRAALLAWSRAEADRRFIGKSCCKSRTCEMCRAAATLKPRRTERWETLSDADSD